MLTNDSVLVQLYYYSSSTAHIQAIPLRAYSHVHTRVLVCTNSTSHVRKTKSEGRASTADTCQLYLTAYLPVLTYRGHVSGISLPHMPPRLKVSATPLWSDLDVPSKSDNIGTHSADLKSYEISNTLVPRTGHTNQSQYISALSKIAPASCRAGTVSHPKQLEY
jgi:hypothetical protein